jgi:cytochrome b
VAPKGRVLWDAPLRIFHWALVALVVFSFVSGMIGGDWLRWHLRSGYAILALLLFRLAWGFAGGTTARFAHFVRGPRAAVAYARALLRGQPAAATGHNPLGGWMVVAMLVALLVQASTGLFADDEIRTQGPLAVKVSEAMVGRMTAIHDLNLWVVLVLAAVHVTAIGVYQLRLRIDVFWPMVTGGSAPDSVRTGSSIVAAVLLAIAAAAVYWLVAIYPGP